MKIKVLCLPRTIKKYLRDYRNKIVVLPFSKERSNLVDCITFILESKP